MVEIQEKGDLDDDPTGDESLPEIIDLSGQEARRNGTISSSKSAWAVPSLDLLKTVFSLKEPVVVLGLRMEFCSDFGPILDRFFQGRSL